MVINNDHLIDKENIKYLINGQDVFLLQAIPSYGFLVDKIFIDDDGIPFRNGSPELVKSIFDSPPMEKLSNEYAEEKEKLLKLKSEMTALKKEILDLDRQKKEVIAKHQDFLNKCKDFKVLENMENFIDGKITHLVCLCPYRPKIIEYKKSEDRYTPRFPLLTLFGGPKVKELGWKVNEYSDSSGSWTTVIPATSLEEAMVILKEFIMSKDIDKYLVEAAKKYNIPIPEEKMQEFNNKEIEYFKSRISRQNKDIEIIENEMKQFIDSTFIEKGESANDN